MKFTDLNLEVNNATKEVKFKDFSFNVRQYLPAQEKNDIVEIVIQNADAGTVVNSLAIEMLFNTYLVLEYTDIEFEDADRADLFALYDKLNCSGIIDIVIDAIPKEEYDILFTNMEKMYNEYIGYRNSARAVLEQLSIYSPQSAQTLNENLKDFDFEKAKEMMGFADGMGMNN